MDGLTRNEPLKGVSVRSSGVERSGTRGGQAKRVGTFEKGDGNLNPRPSPRCGGSARAGVIFHRVPLRSTRRYVPPSLQDLNYLIVASISSCEQHSMKVQPIETPALLLDMAAMESNLHSMATFFTQGCTRLRPHFKNHKCPALALRQLAAGAIGMTCATVAEAECLVRHGVRSVLIANEIADSIKIDRFIDLARQAEVMVCVDSERVVEALSTAARNKGAQVGVLVDINVGLHRCGVQPGEPAVRLAKAVLKGGLQFRGVMGYEGRVRKPPGPEKVETCNKTLRLLMECSHLIEQAGVPVEIVSTGGTSSYSISGRYPGVTEVQAGSYLVMDTDYFQCCSDFQPALTLLTTIISKTDGERLVVDAGFKAISGERGLPSAKAVEGVSLKRLNAEHGVFELENPSRPLQVGDTMELWVRDADATINLHERMYGIRNGAVEEVLRIEG